MHDALLLSFLYLAVGFVFVGMFVLLWVCIYDWFATNRMMTDTVSRSEFSWNTDHEFFDKVTEFRNDFSS